MKKTLLALSLFTCLFIITMSCLHGDFFIIDDTSLISIPQLRAPFSLPLLKTLFTPGNHIDYYPIRDLSYWLDIHWFGGDATGSDTFIFRIHNIILLTISSVLVCLILELLGAATIAMPIAILWAFHPIHWETMIWASARKDILAIAFTLFSIVCFIKAYQTNKNKWHFLSVMAFILGLMSKVSFGFLPFLGWVIFFGFKSEKIQGKTKLTLLATTFFGIAFSAYQSWFYTHINDMRFFYTSTYRIQASAAALGKMATGFFIPSYNIVDVENWGNWLDFNKRFILIGVLLWGLIIYGLVQSFLKKNKLLFITLITFSILYGPIASLIFPHRNFYSVRYFEAPVLSLFICGGLLLKKISKQRLYSIFGLTISLMLAFNIHNSKNWTDSVAVINYSLSQEPHNFSLLMFQYSELNNLKRWGRLDAQGLLEMDNISKELDLLCNIEAKNNNPNGSLCLNYWAQSPEIKYQIFSKTNKNWSGEVFPEWTFYLNQIKTLNPDRWSKQKTNVEYFLATNNNKLNSSIFNFWMDEHPFQVDDKMRINFWYSLCVTGKISLATDYLKEMKQIHLIDKQSFVGNLNRALPLNFYKMSLDPHLNQCRTDLFKTVFH